MNAYAERVIRSVRENCLSHFVFLGATHLNHVVQEYVDYYNSCRPHSSCGNLPPARAAPSRSPKCATGGPVVCETRLGGLLKHYYRAAA